ncbi:Uncharacterized conserved protein YecT, DUF1311 family [Loktanella sp. DSM 29012]|uniref:DUF1311 domain-containing protein n=1 Tax=Loktanella gaetbuli TaxID=2881335 RepID=A0ABS8BQZ3_9RHOB|nr:MULTISPECIES: lysozyme inhibitor LprI family protein [Loktanella]MCB5198169.1 DUF1311 domain-containing protein [Loktanella gaetbuli]SEQ27828.1 Uncharacterized conserved protein YecT, DUF1311 family [Loktanella sp. DSM 29012]
MKFVLICALALSGATAATAQDLVYSNAATEACLATVTGLDRLGCVGASAGACMVDTPGGDTTVGMGGCFDRERQFWDDALNEAYAALMVIYTESDAFAASEGMNLPVQSDALRDMQRAWIGYRDARCDFERAKWGGGTGGGPATIQCLMGLTAEQTFVLRDGMDGLQ